MRRSPLAATFAALLLAPMLGAGLALSGCHKDEPKPPSPPTSPPAATAPSSTPESGASGNPAEHRADDSATAKPPEAPKPVPLAALPAPVSAPAVVQPELAAASVATLPPSVVAVVGTPSLKALVDAFVTQAKMVPALAMTADPLPFLLEHMKQRFGLADVSWLALDRPLRLAVPDPKTYPDGFLVVLPLVPGTKLQPSAFPSAKAKVEGHWAKLEVAPDKPVYLDLGDDTLTLSSHPGLTKDLAPFLKDLAAWTPSDPLVIDSSVANARTIFAAELAGAKEQMGAIADQLHKAGMRQEQLAAMQSIATGLFGMVQGLDRFGVAIDPRGDFPRIALSFRATPGTPLAATMADLAQKHPTLAPLIPADAWLAVAYNIDLHGLVDADGIAQALTGGAAATTWSPEDAKAFAAAVARFQELATGSSAFWVTASGGFPFAIETAAAVSDGPAARETLLGLLKLAFEKTWAPARQQLVDRGMNADMLPGVAFPDFISGVGRLSKAMGVVPSLANAPGADALALDLDWSRLGAGRIPAALADALMRAVGPRLELAFGSAPTRYAFAIGPHGAARAAEIAAQADSAPVADPWLAAPAKDGFAVVAFRPTRLFRALADFPQLASKREAIGKLPDDPLLVDGKSDGTNVRVTVTLPLKLIMALIGL